MSDNYKEALENYVKVVQARSDNYMETRFPNLEKNDYSVEPGRSFDKIVVSRHGGGGRSVHSFVAKKEISTKTLGKVPLGSIMKAASWSQPARHPRGSIFNNPESALADNASIVYL